MPFMKLERSRVGVPVAVMSGSRLNSSLSSVRACSRARLAPRQKCVPSPKEMCGLGSRPMSKRSGSANTASSRLADA